MDSQTKALIRKYLTGAGVAALGGALGALAPILDSILRAGAGATTPSFGVIGVAMLAGAVGAVRLWYMKQTSGLASIFFLEKSFGDKLASPPAAAPSEDSILYSVMLPEIGPAVNRLVAAPPTMVEVRKFSDPRLQEAVEHVFAKSGAKGGAFLNVNLNGEVRSGVAIKVGGHLSFSGFLIKKPGYKIDGLAEVSFAF
jgi:hypothetical protein